MFVGVDGCKAGWFAVLIDEKGQWSAAVFEDAKHLSAECQHASLILIDIPIGLRDSGHEERACDKEARKALGHRRGSSVFPAPCRPTLAAKSYSEGSAINRRHTGRGLSTQSWAIAAKIREVDDLLGGKPFDGRFRETHPEVCFATLNRCQPMQHSKKSQQGFAERLAVLRRVYQRTDAVVDHALSCWKRKEVAKDDILDALAAAVTAYLGRGDLRTHPAQPETDSKGRPMEIVYYGGSADAIRI